MIPTAITGPRPQETIPPPMVGLCAVCGEYRVMIEQEFMPFTDMVLLIARCHGKEDRIRFPWWKLEDRTFRIPCAFQKERDELDRLENEDAALAAAGLADAVDERLAAEDSALGAIVVAS